MKLIAHRSGPVSYPEQTVASAREALSLGADMIEIDVRYTADKKLAVCHDANAKRVFGVDKLISEMNCEEFLSLRHQTDPAYPAHLFEDYLKCGITPLLIHIKESQVIDDLLSVIDAYGYQDKVVMGVSNIESARRVRTHNPAIQILSFAGKNLLDDFIREEIEYIRLWENWLTPELVEKVKSSRSQLWVMSGSTEGNPPVGEPTKAGLKLIYSYAPDGMLINDIRQAKGMHPV